MTPEQWADSALVLVERSRIVECFKRCAAEARAAALHEVIDHLETMFGYVDAVREVRGLLAVGVTR